MRSLCKSASPKSAFTGIKRVTHILKNIKKIFHKSPDFDVLAEDPDKASIILKERLEDLNYKNIKIIKHEGIGEMIAPHYEIKLKVGKIDETIAFIYKPLACHSYNNIKIGNKNIRVATIDTMLSFYFAFFYSNRDYYDENRILCMAQYLFDVQQKNRLQQKGLLKRFSINCYGKQETLEDMRNIKSQKFKDLANKRNSKEYESWFLRYIPFENYEKKESKSKTKRENKTKKRKSTNKRKTKKNIFGF